ncbi:hypothetical protein IJG73_01475, partial [Candidatus Saccharibacteria bacterium]|nr:hypothetical protein [Candidatus Saccharibacteria bacterium]
MFFGSIDYIGHTNAANSDVSVDIGQVLSMRVTKNNADITELNLDVDPLPTGRFIKDHLSVLVSTSNTTGYTLTMADNDTNTALTHTDVTVTDAINSITTTPSDPNATTMESNFPTNSWAYGLGDPTSTAQTFFRIPLPSAADTIKTTSAAATDDPTQVTFAAKVDTNLTAGTYQDTVIFSATPNYVPRTLTDITTMQQMSSEICANTPTPSVTETNVPEVTLLDVRGKDGTGTIENPATGTNQQTYLVRKLADGNCWMAQNLNLNLSTAVSLNNTTTDLNSKTFWTPAVSTQTAVGTTWALVGADGIHSFEPGDLYFPHGVGSGTADTYGNLTGATSGADY